MKLIDTRKDKSKIVIELTCDELGGLHNALLESMEALDPIEFSTRMGVTIREVEKMMRDIRKIYEANCGRY